MSDDLEDVGHCEGCGEIVIQEPHGGHTRAEPDKNGDPIPVQCGPVHLIRDMEDQHRAEIARLRAELDAARDRYVELIMAVENKYPGETRHETALRYIREAERREKLLAVREAVEGEVAFFDEGGVTMEDFREALEQFLNRHCMENESNTPDFILADYLTACLRAFNSAANERSEWYERHDAPGREPAR